MTNEPSVRHFDGREQYEAALDELLPHASSRIRVFDREFSPHYSSTRRIEVLRSFVLADRNRKIWMLAHDASKVASHCPRLVNLLRQFSQAVSIHQTSEEAARIYDPFCITDEAGYVRRFHFDDARGVTSLNDEVTARDLVRRFDEMWELSTPALSATTLGL